MATWILNVSVLLGVHLVVFLGLPKDEVATFAGWLGLGDHGLSVALLLGSFLSLHLFGKRMHRQGWMSGYFTGHVDGLEDARFL